MDLAAPASAGKYLLKNKFGFSAFVSSASFTVFRATLLTHSQPYELGRAAKKDLETYGPLVFHKGQLFRRMNQWSSAYRFIRPEHVKGGHFPALDSPSEFVGDLQEFFGGHWLSA